MDLNLDAQENTNINSSYNENPNKKYINSINNINNNLNNKETNNTTDEKKKKSKSKKSLFDKYNITTKLIINFFRYFLIIHLNYLIKKSIKNYQLFKNICLQKLNEPNSKYLFNLTIENVFKSFDILKKYSSISYKHNLTVVEKILKSNETEIKNILSLKVKNYFKNYYMSKEENNIEFMNNNLLNFEGFLNQEYQNQLDYFDKKTLDEYIQKIRKVALKLINDNENEDKHDIQIVENNLNSDRPEENIQKIREVAFELINDNKNEDKHDIQIEENNLNSDRPEENNTFENFFYSIHNYDEHPLFFNDDFDEKFY